MKKMNLISTLLLLLILSTGSYSSGSNSVNIPCNTNAAIDTYIENEVHHFELQNLCPLAEPAFYSYLWWMGDNGFCFTAAPEYQFQNEWADDSITVVCLATGNYSSGGPPPAHKRVSAQEKSSQPPLVIPDGNLYMQHYRNAVINDTIYLIISYQLSGDSSGQIFLNVPPEAKILEGMMALPQYHSFTPNNETYLGSGQWEYSNLNQNYHYSMLVPILILPNEKEKLEFQVSFTEALNEGSQIGIDYFPLDIPMAKSHDPNQITEYSDAVNNCDYGGKPINYTIDFQNIGNLETYYVKVICQLDTKLDFSSLNHNNFEIPALFNGYLRNGVAPNHTGVKVNPKGSNQLTAFYQIDPINHQLTFEFPGLALLGTQDSSCTNLNFTKDQVSFSINMLPNYRFGDDVKSNAEIFFDTHSSIFTNDAITTCKGALSMTNGGGFYSTVKPPQKTIKCIYIIIGLVLIILGLILYIIKLKGKKSK